MFRCTLPHHGVVFRLVTVGTMSDVSKKKVQLIYCNDIGSFHLRGLELRKPSHLFLSELFIINLKVLKVITGMPQ